MAKIKEIKAREILDSRGNPTLEVKIFLENGIWARASVPSGASTGAHEALELRDNNLLRYAGKGVLKAKRNVEEIIRPHLIGLEIGKQKEIDQIMLDLDGTENKSALGANAILAISLCAARLGALDSGLALYQYLRQIYDISEKDFLLPTPMFNVINGGVHAENDLDVQEFMLVTKIRKEKFSRTLEEATEIFHLLKNLLKSTYGFSIAVADEGGFAPPLRRNEMALKILSEAVERSVHRLGEDVFFALDVASSEFYDAERKSYLFEGESNSAEEMMKIYEDWLKKYPLISLEDPLAEDDWMAWQKLTQKFKEEFPKILLVGDDLFTTNPTRLKKGIELGAANTILIKPNQIGTLTETIDCIKLAQKNHYKIVISHRSGETTDDFIADLAVAVNADFIKAGAPSRGERIAKYNRLMEIEEELEVKE